MVQIGSGAGRRRTIKKAEGEPDDDALADGGASRAHGLPSTCVAGTPRRPGLARESVVRFSLRFFFEEHLREHGIPGIHARAEEEGGGDHCAEGACLGLRSGGQREL